MIQAIIGIFVVMGLVHIIGGFFNLLGELFPNKETRLQRKREEERWERMERDRLALIEEERQQRERQAKAHEDWIRAGKPTQGYSFFD